MTPSSVAPAQPLDSIVFRMEGVGQKEATRATQKIRISENRVMKPGKYEAQTSSVKNPANGGYTNIMQSRGWIWEGMKQTRTWGFYTRFSGLLPRHSSQEYLDSNKSSPKDLSPPLSLIVHLNDWEVLPIFDLLSSTTLTIISGAMRPLSSSSHSPHLQWFQCQN